MDELRWILLALGTLIVVGVYSYTRWQDWQVGGFPWQRKGRQRVMREPFADQDEPNLDEADPLLDTTVVGEVRYRQADEPIIEPGLDPSPDPSSKPSPEPDAEPAAKPAEDSASPTVPPFLRRKAAASAEATVEPASASTDIPDVPSVDASTKTVPEQQPRLDLGEPDDADGTAVIDDQGDEKIIALSVMAPAGQPWNGAALSQCLTTLGLKLDAQGVFLRRRDKTKNAPTLYTVANIIEPGVFDPKALDAESTPGVVFIMQLPGPFDGLATFEQMLVSARELARQLQGQVLDGRRCDLTQQALEHMREELREYRRRARLADRRQR